MRLLDKLADAPAPEALLGLLDGEHTRAHLVTFVNGYSYQVLREQADLVKHFDAIYVDGILLAVLASVVHLRGIPRRSFDMTSLAPTVFGACEARGSRVAIVGSTPAALEKFRQVLTRDFPALKVVYSRSGYFETDDEWLSAIESLRRNEVEVLICGMGTGPQERFLVDAAQSVETLKLGFSCGGFIHQGAEGLRYYPPVVDKLQLRWLYRLFREKHTRARFFRTYPRLFPALLRDALFYRPIGNR